MTPLVVIVGPAGDMHAQAVAAVIRRDHAATVCQVDLQDFPQRARATFATGGESRRRWHGPNGVVDLDDVRSIWWRRPQASLVPHIFGGANHTQFLQTECDHFVQGLLWSGDVLWVNDPRHHLHASRKIVQLSHARQAGLAVPQTLITNEPADARAFLDALPGRAVYKRTGAGPGPASKTSFVTPEVRSQLDAIADCPTTFQAYVDALYDLRVVWLDGQAWAVAIDSQAGVSPEDCRFDNSVGFKPCELPGSVARALDELMSSLGLVYGAIDLRLGLDGEYYFLEVNPSGQFVYLELKTGLPLMSSLAALLAAGGRISSPGRSGALSRQRRPVQHD